MFVWYPRKILLVLWIPSNFDWCQHVIRHLSLKTFLSVVYVAGVANLIMVSLFCCWYHRYSAGINNLTWWRCPGGVTVLSTECCRTECRSNLPGTALLVPADRWLLYKGPLSQDWGVVDFLRIPIFMEPIYQTVAHKHNWNKLAKLRRHASRVHFEKILFR